MKAVLRRSMPARIAACGFIAIILFGNLWLTYALLGRQIPAWMSNGFAIGTGTSIVGGILLVGYAIRLKFRPLSDDIDDLGRDD